MIYQTHYEVLQVARSASPEVIRAAYESLSQLWRPDRNPDRRAEAEYRTKGFDLAYEVLSDPQKRKAYDVKLDSEAKVEEPKRRPRQEPKSLPTSPAPKEMHRILVEPKSSALFWNQRLIEGIGIETLGGVFTEILAKEGLNNSTRPGDNSATQRR